MIEFAYIDPGLGLLAWQTVVAACLGTLFYVKKTRTWIAKVVGKLLHRSKRTETSTAGPEVPASERSAS